MNRDFVEMLSALCEAQAEFMIVGAHALAAHGHPRATGDLDVWVRPSEANATRVLAALTTFGAPLFDLSNRSTAAPDALAQAPVRARPAGSDPRSTVDLEQDVEKLLVFRPTTVEHYTEFYALPAEP